MNKICKKSMSFQDCELAILRLQVDKAQNKMSRRLVESSETSQILKIVENFIMKKKLVCYGGIAINALLPKNDKIYNEDIDIPDYDFFTANGVEDAKSLADEFYKKGFTEVEAKAAQHHNTFKVYVNFMAVADITNIPEELFKTIRKRAKLVKGIYYTDENFLRMGMYLELSRPSGDTDRWEKVLKRLILINKYYPIKTKNCNTILFQRKMENNDDNLNVYNNVKKILIDEKVIFFGGYAISKYKQYMPSKVKNKISHIPDFDVLSNDPKQVALKIEKELSNDGYEVKIIEKQAVGEIIPIHYEINVNNETIAFLYNTIACHNYNIADDNGKKIRIATIDTILNFYFAFIYANRPYYDENRLLCMADLLFKVQEKNRLEQKGILKRFSIVCLGKQPSREQMREEKSNMYYKLNKGSKEYDTWFLSYRPHSKNKKETIPIKTKTKTKTKTKQNKKKPSKKKSKKKKTILL